MRGDASAPPKPRVRWTLLVLLWIWAGTVFLVLDLFLNVSFLDRVRPRHPYYDALRKAGHKMVGEAYEADPAESAGRARPSAPRSILTTRTPWPLWAPIVVDAQGAPLADVLVLLKRVGRQEARERWSARSNGSGVARFENLQRDVYLVTYGGRDGVAAARRTFLLDPPAHQAPARLEVPSRVAVRVIATLAGSSLEGATVTAQAGTVRATARTGPEGDCTLRLAPASYDVWLQKQGVVLGRREVHVASNAIDIRHDVAGLGTVQGLVRASSGNAGGVRVVLTRDLAPIAVCVTNRHGRFELPRVPAGQYEIHAGGYGRGASSARARIVSGESSTAELLLPEPQRLRLAVFSKRTGARVQKYRVRIRDNDGFTTEVDGQDMLTDARPGQLVTVTAPGHARGTHVLGEEDLTRGQIELRLAPTWFVRGTVLHRDGSAPTAFEVRVRQQHRWFFRTAGRFEFERVDDGRVHVSVKTIDDRSASHVTDVYEDLDVGTLLVD